MPVFSIGIKFMRSVVCKFKWVSHRWGVDGLRIVVSSSVLIREIIIVIFRIIIQTLDWRYFSGARNFFSSPIIISQILKFFETFYASTAYRMHRAPRVSLLVFIKGQRSPATLFKNFFLWMGSVSLCFRFFFIVFIGKISTIFMGLSVHYACIP